MVFGMSLAIYTLIHVIIGLIGIGSGLIVLFGMFGGPEQAISVARAA